MPRKDRLGPSLHRGDPGASDRSLCSANCRGANRSSFDTDNLIIGLVGIAVAALWRSGRARTDNVPVPQGANLDAMSGYSSEENSVSSNTPGRSNPVWRSVRAYLNLNLTSRTNELITLQMTTFAATVGVLTGWLPLTLDHWRYVGQRWFWVPTQVALLLGAWIIPTWVVAARQSQLDLSVSTRGRIKRILRLLAVVVFLAAISIAVRGYLFDFNRVAHNQFVVQTIPHNLCSVLEGQSSKGFALASSTACDVRTAALIEAPLRPSTVRLERQFGFKCNHISLSSAIWTGSKRAVQADWSTDECHIDGIFYAEPSGPATSVCHKTDRVLYTRITWCGVSDQNVSLGGGMNVCVQAPNSRIDVQISSRLSVASDETFQVYSYGPDEPCSG